MGHRDRVRVEFGLTPDIAEAVYAYAKSSGLSLSAAGNRLLNHALTHIAGVVTNEADRHATDTASGHRHTERR
ncbi:hypothetical protein BA059_04925 [Mycolicibacterium sp. (ex Dasyatis americana)]|nr:hypothetical protein BA059_04925 [Mycolicibacterium sp. (ex Dasyatis americana)]